MFFYQISWRDGLAGFFESHLDGNYFEIFSIFYIEQAQFYDGCWVMRPSGGEPGQQDEQKYFFHYYNTIDNCAMTSLAYK
jgi:hypothetical protein